MPSYPTIFIHITKNDGMAQFVYYALALVSGHFVVITMPTAVISRDGWQALRSLDLPFVFTEAAGAFAEDIVRIAEGTFTVAEGTFRIIARRDMDISWLEMIVAELDTGIACHEITLMGCCMGM